MKKSLKIIAIVLGIAIIGLIYYYFFFAQNNTSGTPNPIQSVLNLFPFGNDNNNPTPVDTATSTDVVLTPAQTGSYLQKLRLISNEPVAGATFITGTSSTLAIRYMEKATGHIYDVSTSADTVEKISNTTIPKIHEAFFTEGGKGVLARYLGDNNEIIQTVYGKVGSSTTLTLLPENISFLSVAPSGKNIFYVTGTNGSLNTGSTGILASPNASTKKQIWTSPIGHVIPQFVNDTQVMVATSPNAGAPGSIYTINTNTAALKNVLGQYFGLSAIVNPAGNTLLTSSEGSLFTYSMTTGTTSPINPATFPEKCVFDSINKTVVYCAVPKSGIDRNSLDNWYLGLVSFSDDIWKYNISNNTATLVEDLPVDAGRAIDAIHLQLNTAGSILTFESKTDGSLWSLNVTM